MTTEHEKIAAIKADAFELGMHALLKEAGCTSQAEAEHFMKVAAELSRFETKEAALKALKGLGEKAVGAVKEHPKTVAGIGAAGAACVVSDRASKDEKKKSKLPFGKK